ncbi:hypothetical protein [Selenomonas massiliensis]|uniref:hypothetical protein n=1 Tax=Selenomonas massiliensis TaxID=2058293 RepID=UPI000D0F65DC|nr:hypothetical protein [Selenomonas massiliensis]
MKEFILMEVTAETIRDYGIFRNEVEWCRIGNRRVQAVKVLATYEVFTFYKRSVLREQQQECRAKYSCIYKNRKNMCDHNCESCTHPVYRESWIGVVKEEIFISESLETTCIKRLLIEALITEVNKLAPMDQLLLKLIGEAVSEREIARIMGGRSKTAIHKRKEKLFVMLRKKLENTVTIKPRSVCTLVKGGKQNVR